jgi:two-component system, OmpR family, sensor histidine kinase ChvG
VHVRVRDHGPGVPADELATIFERVVQGRRRDRRAAGGTGLGLAIVRTLVGLHGGRVGVRNLDAGDGGGAEFTVTLPLGGRADATASG